MRAEFLLFFEYAQALLLLIYYWIKSLARLLFVTPVRKNISREIILVTGAGECRRDWRGVLTVVVRLRFGFGSRGFQTLGWLGSDGGALGRQ